MGTAGVAALGVAPLSLVERVAVRRWPRRSPGLLVWASSLAVGPVVLRQARWVAWCHAG